MILITFALPDESRPFLRRLDCVKRISGSPLYYTASFRDRPLGLLYVGMGEAACRAALASELAAELAPERIIAAGVAGALNPAIGLGQVLCAANFTSGDLLPSEMPAATMTTVTETVATVAGKRALRDRTGADLVDMETEIIADFARRRAIPMLAVRSISDTAEQDFPLPPEVMFDTALQRPKIAALVSYLLTHPGRIAPFIRFVRGVGTATENLARELVRLLS